MYISGVQLEGGTDTTVAELLGFILAMLLFPDVQKTAQQDLDRVCGDRLPTLADESSLPYVRGLVKETLRWFPTAVLGLPHATTQEDTYKGYRIPKAATVLINVWYAFLNLQCFQRSIQRTLTCCTGISTKTPRGIPILPALIPRVLSTMSRVPQRRLATLTSQNGTNLFLVLVEDFVPG